jgi:hypothetical protein
MTFSFDVFDTETAGFYYIYKYYNLDTPFYYKLRDNFFQLNYLNEIYN